MPSTCPATHTVMSVGGQVRDRELPEPSCPLGFWCMHISLGSGLPLAITQVPHNHSGWRFGATLCRREVLLAVCSQNTGSIHFVQVKQKLFDSIRNWAQCPLKILLDAPTTELGFLFVCSVCFSFSQSNCPSQGLHKVPVISSPQGDCSSRLLWARLQTMPWRQGRAGLQHCNAYLLPPDLA